MRLDDPETTNRFLMRYPVRPGHVIWEAVDDTVILVNLVAGKSAVLNSAAAKFWRLINGKRTQEAIGKRLLKSFKPNEVALDALQAHLSKMMKFLQKNGFVEVRKTAL